MKGRSRAKKSHLKHVVGIGTALAFCIAAGSIALAESTDSEEHLKPFTAQDSYNAISCDLTADPIIITIEPEGCVLATLNAPDSELQDTQEPKTAEQSQEPALFRATANAAGLSSSDQNMLLRVAMSEAEDQGVKGMALVMRVVLNRVASSAWPNTVEGVIMQKSQFEVISNGRYYRVTPNAACYEALEMVLNGWDESQGAMYFCMAGESRWHERNLTRLFQYKDHVFYK